jgi:hypothetical protein
MDIKISPVSIKQGGKVHIEVFVKDETSLIKTAPYAIQVDSNQYNGYLILSKNKGTYETIFKAPGSIKGKVHLKTLELSDYLGNKKKYQF